MIKRLSAFALALAGIGLSAQAATVVQPSFSRCEKPVWPAEALRNEYQGMVGLALMIDVDGDVQETRVEQSSGYPVLDQAAAQAIGSCKFNPRKVNGRPAPSVLKMQYQWTLPDWTPADAAKAAAAARVSAERGEAAGQYRLAQMYLRGDGVTRDRAEAEKWLRLAAAQGHAGAQDQLGVLLVPDDDYAGNAEEAVAWFRKAAEQGRARSQYYLGVVLLKQGQTDVALDWLKKSAAQNYPAAQHKLAALDK
ncbi:TonB family protein [Duganella sp. FT80W]|uniref:TonB family protein n=1 Tax=Duganella guangzhouensis TaxID=2666084 RepID=A0A6I2KX99_9BURK|nr:TonB family protein [Duganella guangzhouensis]MRW89044.1 TonB family protein [Duganella guangzhouensis]